MAKRSKASRRSPGLNRALGLSSKPKTKPRSKALASVSHSALRRASPNENVRMGFSPTARRYVKAGVKVTKATASISARAAETKRTRERYGFHTPEAATKARGRGELSYESQTQARRVEKAQETTFLKRLRTAGRTQKRFVEHDETGAIKRNKGGRPRTFQASTTGLATALYIYDVSSCYPAGAVELPSLAPEHGRWIKHDAAGLGFKSLAELKLRGARVKNYKLNKDGEPWLVANVLPIWRTMTELPERGDGSGLVTRDYKQLITIGSALSFRRWKLAGRWSPEPGEAMAHQRSINAHELGVKRMLNIHKLNELLNCERPANVAKRAYELVPTIPTINRDPALSRPRPPEWIDEETGERIEGEGDMADAMAGARS